MMRDAFEHDSFGHLSAFYLPVGGKPRWVRLGIIEPYGGGEDREPLVSPLD